jgi:hypothetical protein
MTMSQAIVNAAITVVAVVLLGCATFEIKKFETSKSMIRQGEEILLTWNVEAADSIWIDKEKGNLSAIDKYSVKPAKTTTYELYAYNRTADTTTKRKQLTIWVTDTTIFVIPDSIPIPKIERSQVESSYLSGLIPLDSMATNTGVTYEIFAVDRSQYPKAIILFVSVKDKYGNFISHLAPPYASVFTAKTAFASLEEIIGKKNKTISNFNVEEKHLSRTKNCAFGLVLDHSGSMADAIGDLQSSALKFINLMRAGDKAAVVKFDHRIYTEVALNGSSQEISSRYHRDFLSRYGGGTAVYAAAGFGIESVSPAQEEKYVILFTDGQENSSMYYFPEHPATPRDLVFKARSNNTRIITVGCAQADAQTLEKIAILTDGKFYFADNQKEIDQIYSELPRMFNNYYEITYIPTTANGFHNITLNGEINGQKYSTSRIVFAGNDTTGMGLSGETPPQVVAYYDFSKDIIPEESMPYLDKFVNYMKQHLKATMEIRGHTDMTGADEINRLLSEKRAAGVRDVFIQRGVSPNRIKSIGLGKSQPMHIIELHDWQAQENRRVEIIIKN